MLNFLLRCWNAPTKSPKLVCRSRYFPQSLGKSVGAITVRTEERVDCVLKEASASIRGVQNLDRGDRAGQGGVLVKLIIMTVSRKLPHMSIPICNRTPGCNGVCVRESQRIVPIQKDEPEPCPKSPASAHSRLAAALQGPSGPCAAAGARRSKVPSND